MNIDLLRQELDDRLAAAPQEPLITPRLIQRTMQSPRDRLESLSSKRRRVWLIPAGIAASVALVVGLWFAPQAVAREERILCNQDCDPAYLSALFDEYLTPKTAAI